MITDNRCLFTHWRDSIIIHLKSCFWPLGRDIHFSCNCGQLFSRSAIFHQLVTKFVCLVWCWPGNIRWFYQSFFFSFFLAEMSCVWKQPQIKADESSENQPRRESYKQQKQLDYKGHLSHYTFLKQEILTITTLKINEYHTSHWLIFKAICDLF